MRLLKIYKLQNAGKQQIKVPSSDLAVDLRDIFQNNSSFCTGFLPPLEEDKYNKDYFLLCSGTLPTLDIYLSSPSFSEQPKPNTFQKEYLFLVVSTSFTQVQSQTLFAGFYFYLCNQSHTKD